MKFFKGVVFAIPVSLALWGMIFIGIAKAAGTAVSGVVVPRATVNSSAVITTGNTFQTVFTPTSGIQALTVENNNATDSCWLFVGGGSPTKATSILLLAGGAYTRYWPFVPSDILQATCASNADTLYIDFQ